MTGNIKKRMGRGGSSSNRISRLVEESRMNYVNKIVEEINKLFALNKSYSFVNNLILCGGELAEKVLQSQELDYRLRKKNIKIIPMDSNEPTELIIQKVYNILNEYEIIREIEELKKIFELFDTNVDILTYGIDDVKEKIEFGNIMKFYINKETNIDNDIYDKLKNIGCEIIKFKCYTDWHKRLDFYGGFVGVLRYKM